MAESRERRRRPPAARTDRGGGWTGREFEVTVGPVAHGGHCVARHEGRVVFVRHALPGERVVVRVTEDRQPGYCRADAVEVLEAAPDRVPRPCPYSGPGAAAAATGSTWRRRASAGSRRRWCASS
jgi:tRNA/tmRNA/rRNA uracil-C5-methylase (TrmA/RlmC/RlmD family)